MIIRQRAHPNKVKLVFKKFKIFGFPQFLNPYFIGHDYHNRLIFNKFPVESKDS